MAKREPWVDRGLSELEEELRWQIYSRCSPSYRWGSMLTAMVEAVSNSLNTS